jgi:subtilase family serine protease
MYTHYLKYVGPPKYPSIESQVDDPLLGLAGPVAKFFAGPAGFHPVDIHNAYNIPAGLGSNVICIVDAYDLPSNLTDFNTFSKTFNLPVETSTSATAATNKVFQVMYSGGTQPTADADWGGEIALDIEWAHAMAPNAKIVLVEAPSSSGSDLYNAVAFASKVPGCKEISMSWGGGEDPSETATESYFNNSLGIVYFASAGDEGGVQIYPAESPNVVGVGGTSLYMSGAVVINETAWNGSGGGPSSVFSRPTYQNGVQNVTGASRGCPDLAAIADPNTGAAWIDAGVWGVVGGTSLASPVNAGIANARGQFSASTNAELTREYKNFALGKNYFRDITSGTAGSFSALVGWDFITGVGVPNGLYPALAVAVPYPASSVNVYRNPYIGGGTTEGNYLSGNAASLNTVDQNCYSVSTIGESIGKMASVEATFNTPLKLSTIEALGFSFTAYYPSAGTVYVYLWNYKAATPGYVLYTTLSGTQAGTANVLSLSTTGQIDSYLSSTGQVKVLIRALVPNDRVTLAPGTPVLKVDQLEVLGTSQASS